MKMDEPNELSAKLRAWKVEPEVPSAFPREVWQRIAVRQAKTSLCTVRLGEWFSLQVMRPATAFAVVIAILGVSVGAAHLKAQETNAQHWKTLELRYGVSIDPVAMAR